MNAKSFRASLGAIGSVMPFGYPSGAVVHSPAPNEKATDEGQSLEDGDEVSIHITWVNGN